MRAAEQCFPGLPHVACFDTVFHADMPDLARTLPRPIALRQAGIQRYVFHGLSCESIMQQLGDALPARAIIAHLGNGASITAVHCGKSVDTSMGLTPIGGLRYAKRRGPNRMKGCWIRWALMVPTFDWCLLVHRAVRVELNYGAKILAFDATKGTYQVKSDADGQLDGVPAYKQRYSCKGLEAPSVSSNNFTGKWTLFVGPTPHREVIDDKGYLVAGQGAHVPPLQINADGTYAWTVDRKTTVRGSWRAMLRAGTKLPAVLLLNSEGGKNWEVWKTVANAGNNRDAIGVERMDLGQSYQGTRLPE